MFFVPGENIKILISGNCSYIIDTMARDKLENCWSIPLTPAMVPLYLVFNDS